LTSDELLREKTIGDIPGRGAIRRRIGYFHPRLIEVLNKAGTTGCFGVGLTEWGGEGFRAPHPSAANAALGDGKVAPGPGIEEGVVAGRSGLDKER